MPTVRHSRPLAVNIFAAVLLALATWNLAAALWDLPAQEEKLRSLGIGVEWNRDWTIIASSAWFTVELIPIAAVWLYASRFARGFITAMAGTKVVLIVFGPAMLNAALGVLVGQSVSLVAIALLYTRAANKWFSRRPDVPALVD